MPRVQVKQALIEELRNGPQLLPAEQRIVDDAIEALQTEAHDLLVSAGLHLIPLPELQLCCQIIRRWLVHGKVVR